MSTRTLGLKSLVRGQGGVANGWRFSLLYCWCVVSVVEVGTGICPW
jgi:hypothetical protein